LRLSGTIRHFTINTSLAAVAQTNSTRSYT